MGDAGEDGRVVGCAEVGTVAERIKVGIIPKRASLRVFVDVSVHDQNAELNPVGLIRTQELTAW